MRGDKRAVRKSNVNPEVSEDGREEVLEQGDVP